MRFALPLAVMALMAFAALPTGCSQNEADTTDTTRAKPAEDARSSAAEATDATAEAAPDFTLQDQDGNEVSLSDYDGHIVVLEWINWDCPFVQRHYEAGTMKTLAEEYADDGVVWLAINSTHYATQAKDREWIEQYDLPYPILHDPDGEVGHAYDAKTTPHMYIIDRDGGLVYEGAIDDDPRGNKDEPVNYVRKALDELLAGEDVSTPGTRPYGCTVKYAD
ncbi:MAG: thioredoxin family protein [Phycisphaerae bacterium]